ncbi:MAG: hypothetical protein OEZ04_07900 [Nitrospinota bacterium]|nr:hypothetical protein [Nitrospinota bacterium]
MLITLKAFGRLAILVSIVGLVLGVTVVAEIAIDQLTYQSRDLRHLLKHSLGNGGSLLVAFSIAAYMGRKRYKWIPGRLKDWLDVHQWLSVAGVIMVGVHTGAHLRAVVPILAFVLMLACLVSGFIGRVIYIRAQRDLKARRAELLKDAVDPEEVEETLAMATAAAKTLARWKATHRPLSLALGLALFWHVMVALFFGG